MNSLFSPIAKHFQQSSLTSYLLIFVLLLGVFIVGCKPKQETGQQTPEQASPQEKVPPAPKRKFFRILMRGGSLYSTSWYRLNASSQAIEKLSQQPWARFDNGYLTESDSKVECLTLRDARGDKYPVPLPSELEYVQVHLFSDVDGNRRVASMWSTYLGSDADGEKFEHVVESEEEFKETSTVAPYDYTYQDKQIEIKRVQVVWKPRPNGQQTSHVEKFTSRKFGCVRVNDNKICTAGVTFSPLCQ